MVHPSLFSKDSNEWGTPQWLYDLLDDEFHFTLDPAATDDNAKCEYYYTKAENGLLLPWAPDTVFCNPPYGPHWKVAYSWVQKAYEESLIGATVVMLLPVRTSNLWFNDFGMHAYEIRFINDRLTFQGAENVAPFPSFVLIFEYKKYGRMRPDIGPMIDARGRK